MTSVQVPPATTAARPAALLPALAALISVVLWASAFVAIRYVGPEVSAGPLALGRLLVGSVVLAPVVLLRRHEWRRPTHRDWPGLLLSGLLWFGLYNVALNAAEQRIDAGTASMLVQIGPIVIAGLAGWLLHEGFPRRLVIGTAVAFAGALLIGTPSLAGAGGTDGLGVVLCVVAAVSYAVGLVAQKPVLARLPALEVTWMACTIAAVCCLPFAPVLIREIGDAPPATIGWVLYLGVLPTAVAFSTWAYALSATTAGSLGATTYLVPPLTITMGWLLLDETPPWLAVVGGALCLAGVGLSRHAWPRRRRTTSPASHSGGSAEPRP